jgi:iron-sulfur cluster assembly protein
MKYMEETTATPATMVKDDIIVTDRAAAEIKRIMAENNIPETNGLRVGVVGGGCSGMSYSLGFDAEPQATDRTLASNGIRIFIDPKSLFYLSGTELDFSDGLMGRGFVFNNPNASKTCGCGNSFGV